MTIVLLIVVIVLLWLIHQDLGELADRPPIRLVLGAWCRL